MENLRKYRYRTISQSQLYKQVVSRIYKRSFIDQINIDRPFDITYQLTKEGRIEGAGRDAAERAKQIRDQQRELFKMKSSIK